MGVKRLADIWALKSDVRLATVLPLMHLSNRVFKAPGDGFSVCIRAYRRVESESVNYYSILGLDTCFKLKPTFSVNYVPVPHKTSGSTQHSYADRGVEVAYN
jgi:hypothetical protein